jgi:hypothetical protein
VAERGQKQLIPLQIKKVNHTIIANAQSKFRPALEPAVGKGIQATTQVADISQNPGANIGWQFEENRVELA